jgi:succinoglycan biosynthesis transport protein ExoP
VTGLLVAGLLTGFFLHPNERPTYTSAARVLLDMETSEPASPTEASAIADTARAIVTSRSIVEGALSKAGLSRSASRMVLDEQISVSTVGSSAIVEVAVTDPDPEAAAELANILAEDLIATRLTSTTGTLEDALSEIQGRIPALEASLEVLNARIPEAPKDTQERLLRQQDLLAQQLVILEEKRGELLAKQAEQSTPQIIDRARLAVQPDPSRRPMDVALGGLLGLFLGIGLSLILERARPTVIGLPAVSRELEAPVLGFLTTPPRRARSEEIAPVAAWLSTAAESAEVRTVALVSTLPGDGLETLAAELSERIDGAQQLRIRPLELPGRGNRRPARNIPSSAGVVVVTPVVARKTDLDAVRDLFGMTGRPVLGAIAYRGSGNGAALARLRRVFRAGGQRLLGLTPEVTQPRGGLRPRKVSQQ